MSLFVVLEGIDGSGKTTQTFLLEHRLRKMGRRVYATREPTDGIIGGIIRAALTTKLRITHRTLQILFAADRSEHVKEIEDRIKAGYDIICDRYYISSIAYGMVDLDIDWLIKMNSVFPEPDITILLDIPAEIALKRLGDRYSKTFFERRAFLSKVRENFIELSKLFKNFHIVDGSRSEEEVHRDIFKIVSDYLD
ncbi:TPA: dTMP kinase [Candidatus Geothermarchaeota archaeon]|nr:dTMP kinase [Candidatus Geothermarchaeota archaeon]HIQ13870.1 dTMP kinase [Thermoprotei archaeon]